MKNTNKLKRCGKEFTREKAKKEIDLTLKIAKKCHGKIDEIPTSFQISLPKDKERHINDSSFNEFVGDQLAYHQELEERLLDVIDENDALYIETLPLEETDF